MAELTQNDASMLRQTGGSDGEGTDRWLMLRRKGHVLLCLPDDARYSKGIELYQPQSTAARLTINLLKNGGPLARKFFPFLRQSWGGGGFLNWLETVSGEMPTAALLGNAVQKERRVVILSEKDGKRRIWKVGFSRAAREAIEHEHQKLSALPGKLEGVPEVSDLVDCEDWAAFSMPFFSGKSVAVADLPDVIDLLRNWLLKEECPALEFPAIGALEIDHRGGLANLRLRRSVAHGDFASWNVLKQADGRLQVIDWEMASTDEGVPGWDIAHFLLQEAQLVRKMDDSAALKWVQDQLKLGEIDRYLREVGWGVHRQLMLITYLKSCEQRGSFHFGEIRTILQKQLDS